MGRGNCVNVRAALSLSGEAKFRQGEENAPPPKGPEIVVATSPSFALDIITPGLGLS